MTFSRHDGNEEMKVLFKPIIRLIEGDVRDRKVLEVACGTGNWTQVLSGMARRVVATDLIEDNLEIARSKDRKGVVTFQVANAYELEGVKGPFEAAFAADWWSHMPLSMVGHFLRTLHSMLRPGARVVMVDMLRTESFELAFSGHDAEGNELQHRTLPGGGSFQIIKNFPDGTDLLDLLEEWGSDATYHEVTSMDRWVLRYSVPR
jgi:demethylmenaquinone methyltransferase/2-methoxy-6-polyprenyl-1,4-benzoquinol methylase